MAAITSAVLGATMGAVAIAKGTAETVKAKKAGAKAREDVETHGEKMERYADVNTMQALSLPTDLYDTSIKNIRAMGTQGIQTLGDMGARGAFGVGGILTAGTEQLEKIRGEQAQGIYGLNYAKAVSEQERMARLQDIEAERVRGAQQKEYEAEQARKAGIESIIGGAGQLGAGIAGSVAMYKGGKNAGNLGDALGGLGEKSGNVLGSMGLTQDQIGELMALSGDAQGQWLRGNLSKDQQKMLMQIQGMSPEQMEWMFPNEVKFAPSLNPRTGGWGFGGGLGGSTSMPSYGFSGVGGGWNPFSGD